MSFTTHMKYLNSRKILGYSKIVYIRLLPVGSYVRYKRGLIGFVCSHYRTHCTICFGRVYRDLNERNKHHYELVVLSSRRE